MSKIKLFNILFGVFLLVWACSKEENKPQEIRLERVTLNQENIELSPGGVFQFSGTFTPESAFDKTLVWSSSEYPPYQVHLS